jgi:6-phosphogluconolactonase
LVSVFAYDAENGTLRNVQDISTLPEDFREFSITADIHVHPSGRFLYASNRGHDSLVSYAIDEASGRLKLIGFTPTGGQHPRNFAFTPDARLLLVANLNTDTIVALAIDEASGQLRANGTVNAVPAPSCITFLVT